jgi:hypothetical protein
MKRLLGRVVKLFKTLAGLILPVFRKARGPGGLAPELRVALGVLVLLAFLVGLYYLNQFSWIRDNLPVHETLAQFWLPILGLGLIAFWWLSYWLWLALIQDDDGPRFADIDAAWEEAKAALVQARLWLNDLPLILILGEPEYQEQALFQDARLKLEVRQVPGRSDAPLHLYATRKAIFLTCAGASVLGRYARALSGQRTNDEGEEARPDSDSGDFMEKTLTPGARGFMMPTRGPAEIIRVLQQAQSEGRQLTRAEKRELRLLYRQDQPNRAASLSDQQIADQTARLRYLCRLLVRDRHPFPAVNGVLVLIPFASTDSDQEASSTTDALHHDLTTTAALKVDCPLFAMVCDLETAPGFTEFVQLFEEDERSRRLGQSCPLVPDFRAPRQSGLGAFPPEGRPSRMLESLANWICRDVVPRFVAGKFQLETEKTPPEELAGIVRTNSRLFLLTDDLKQRNRRLASILVRGLDERAKQGQLLFGGCYLAGTGPEPAQEQAFVLGVLELLTKTRNVNAVYWNAETRTREAQYERWVNVGWTVLAVLGLAVAAAVGFLLLKE